MWGSPSPGQPEPQAESALLVGLNRAPEGQPELLGPVCPLTPLLSLPSLCGRVRAGPEAHLRQQQACGPRSQATGLEPLLLCSVPGTRTLKLCTFVSHFTEWG